MNKIILFLVVCLCLSGCSEDYYIREADRYHKLGEFEKAIEYYDKALVRNPDNYEVYIVKGIIYLKIEKEEEAVKIFSEVINRFPPKAYAYSGRAESYMRMEKYEKALEDYNSTLKILVRRENDPIRLGEGVFPLLKDNIDPYAIYADRAVVYYYLDSIKPAWIDLNYCISKSKYLAQCYYWRAFVYFKINNTPAACDDLKKAASLGNSDALDYYKKYCDCDTIKQ